MKPLSNEEQKAFFEKVWIRYWYKNKPVSRRLLDDMGGEREVCAAFFQALQEEAE